MQLHRRSELRGREKVEMDFQYDSSTCSVQPVLPKGSHSVFNFFFTSKVLINTFFNRKTGLGY